MSGAEGRAPVVGVPFAGGSGRISDWYGSELARLPRRTAAVVEWIRRHPGAVIVPVTVVRYLVDVVALGAVSTPERFREAGESLWGAHPLDVFSDSWLQIGPLYLAVLGGAGRLLGLILPPGVIDPVLSVIQAIVITLAALAVTRSFARRAGSEGIAARWAVGLVLGLGGLMSEASHNGHPEEALLAVMLLASVLLVSSGKPVRGGLMLGAAVAIKQWALLGPVALLGRLRVRRLVPSTLAAVGLAVLVTSVAYLPFLIFGKVHTFDLVWNPVSDVPQDRLWAALGATSWTTRVVQGAAAGAAGALVALRRRDHPEVAVLTLVGVKLLLEPVPLTYYIVPVAIVFTVWSWTSQQGPRLRWRLGAAVVPTVLLWLAGSTLDLLPLFWALCDVAIIACLVSALVLTRPSSRPQPQGVVASPAVSEYHATGPLPTGPPARQ